MPIKEMSNEKCFHKADVSNLLTFKRLAIFRIVPSGTHSRARLTELDSESSAI